MVERSLMTSGRLVSMCGQMGVSTTASSVGWMMGPPGGEVVGGGARGRGDDEAVRAERGDEEAVHGHVQLDDAGERGLGDHDVVEDVARRLRRVPLLHAGAEHAPLLEPVFAAQHALEGRVQLRHRDLGEEPEAAEVHAQHRHRAVDEVAGGEEGAVAPQHDEHVRAGRDLAAGGHAAGLARGDRPPARPCARRGRRAIAALPAARPRGRARRARPARGRAGRGCRPCSPAHRPLQQAVQRGRRHQGRRSGAQVEEELAVAFHALDGGGAGRDHDEASPPLGPPPPRRAVPAGASPGPSRYHRARPARARPRTGA